MLPTDEHLIQAMSHVPWTIRGEVYMRLKGALPQMSARVQNPKALARTVVSRESRRAHGRERSAAAKHTPTSGNLVAELGQSLDINYRPAPREPLDDLTHQEDCRRVREFLERLSECDKTLLLTSISQSYDATTLDHLARLTGVSVRTLQRRRKELLDRLRQYVGGSP